MSRSLVQNLVKEAQEQALHRSRVGQKTASEKCTKCDKDPCECPKEKKASQGIPTDFVEKLAAAVEYAAPILVGWAKSAEAGPAGAGKGVSASSQSGTPPGPGETGHGHHQPPPSREVGSGSLATDDEKRPGGNGTQETALDGQKKAAVHLAKMAKAMGVKVADEYEDGNATHGNGNPSHTLAAGEAGPPPANGRPEGPTSLVGSNQVAQTYDRRQAYQNRIKDLGPLFSEKAMNASTDNVLQRTFAHTGEAGPKIAQDHTVKVAAARALLSKLEQGNV